MVQTQDRNCPNIPETKIPTEWIPPFLKIAANMLRNLDSIPSSNLVAVPGQTSLLKLQPRAFLAEDYIASLAVGENADFRAHVLHFQDFIACFAF